MTLLRRLARVYRHVCAREDARRLGLSLPDGVWLCGLCQHFSWDSFSFAWHGIEAHA